MSHPKVERIEKIVDLANNFKNKSDQSLKSSKKFEQKLKEKLKEGDESLDEKESKKESYQDMIDRLFFEEGIK